MRRPTPLLYSCCCLLALGTGTLQADEISTAAGFGLDTMAPEGHWAARLEIRSNHYDQRYENQGHARDLGAPFSAVQLDASVFPPLALFGPGASLGRTSLHAEVGNRFALLTLGYGLGEDLTVGAILPYAESHTRVRFRVRGGNVGLNPAFDPAQPVGPGNLPLLPVAAGVPAADTASIQRILSDPAFGYAYEPVRSTRSAGAGDPTFGLLWRFHRDAASSTTLGFGLRPGVARADDPDDLFDVPPGDGNDDIRLRLEHFRDLGGGFDLRLLAESYTQLSDEVTLRVPSPGALLAPASQRIQLKRDLGDYREYDLELGWRWHDWRVAATWHRYEKSRDHYHSNHPGLSAEVLEQDTAILTDQYRLSLGWSGVRAWQRGQLPLPLVLKLEMQDTPNGRNFVAVRDLYLQITTLF